MFEEVKAQVMCNGQKVTLVAHDLKRFRELKGQGIYTDLAVKFPNVNTRTVPLPDLEEIPSEIPSTQFRRGHVAGRSSGRLWG